MDLKQLFQELKALNKEEQEAQIKLKAARDTQEINDTRNKILFLDVPGKEHIGSYGKWGLNPFQKECFAKFKHETINNPHFNHLLLTGPNQFGKTFTEIALILTFYYGRYPWEPVGSPTWLWNARGLNPDKRKIRIRWYGGSWESSIRDVLITKWDEWCPEEIKQNGFYQQTKNSQGVVDEMELGRCFVKMVSNFASGGSSNSKEGSTVDLMVCDEPIPKDVYVAGIRGLAAYNGLFVLGATLRGDDSTWITNDLVDVSRDAANPKKNILHCHNHNPKVNVGFGMSEIGQSLFDQQLTDAKDRAIRLEGRSEADFYRVLPDFGPANIIKDFEIPKHWAVVLMIDFCQARDMDITFVAFDEFGTRIQIYEALLNGSGSDIAKQCGDIIDRNQWRVVLAQIDPLAKSDGYHDENQMSTYAKIENEFIRQNRSFVFMKADKHKDEGIKTWNTNIKTTSGHPNFFIFESCKRSIGQCYRLRIDQKTGKPIKKDDDQPENLYRTYLIDISEYDYADRRNDRDEQENTSYRKWGS